MAHMQKIWTVVTTVILVRLTSCTAAFLTGKGAGRQNATDPQSIPAWLTLGRIGGGGGAYLRTRWVIPAGHIDIAGHPSIAFYPSDQYPNGAVSYPLDLSTLV